MYITYSSLAPIMFLCVQLSTSSPAGDTNEFTSTSEAINVDPNPVLGGVEKSAEWLANGIDQMKAFVNQNDAENVVKEVGTLRQFIDDKLSRDIDTEQVKESVRGLIQSMGDLEQKIIISGAGEMQQLKDRWNVLLKTLDSEKKSEVDSMQLVGNHGLKMCHLNRLLVFLIFFPVFFYF